MNTQRFYKNVQTLIIGLLALGFISCTAAPLITEMVPTERVIEGNIPPTGYPMLETADRLTPPMWPTLPGGTPNPHYNFIATPNPAEKVKVINITELAEITPSPTYSVELSRIETDIGKVGVLYVFHPQTGKKLRLGDDSGSAMIGSITEVMVAWRFLCNPCPTFKAGLHLYFFTTGQDVWVDAPVVAAPGTILLDHAWVLYRKEFTPPQRFASQLYAYNYETGEHIFVAERAKYSLNGAAVFRYVTISDNMVAWIGVGPSVNDNTLNVYNLTTHTSRQISVGLVVPQQLGVSRDVVIWRDAYWKAYDLNRNEEFTLPLLPEGWNKSMLSGDGPVTAQGYQLFWELKTDDGQIHYFTGEVVAKAP